MASICNVQIRNTRALIAWLVVAVFFILIFTDYNRAKGAKAKRTAEDVAAIQGAARFYYEQKKTEVWIC